VPLASRASLSRPTGIVFANRAVATAVLHDSDDAAALATLLPPAVCPSLTFAALQQQAALAQTAAAIAWLGDAWLGIADRLARLRLLEPAVKCCAAVRGGACGPDCGFRRALPLCAADALQGILHNDPVNDPARNAALARAAQPVLSAFGPLHALAADFTMPITWQDFVAVSNSVLAAHINPDNVRPDLSVPTPLYRLPRLGPPAQQDTLALLAPATPAHSRLLLSLTRLRARIRGVWAGMLGEGMAADLRFRTGRMRAAELWLDDGIDSENSVPSASEEVASDPAPTPLEAAGAADPAAVDDEAIQAAATSILSRAAGAYGRLLGVYLDYDAQPPAQDLLPRAPLLTVPEDLPIAVAAPRHAGAPGASSPSLRSQPGAPDAEPPVLDDGGEDPASLPRTRPARGSVASQAKFWRYHTSGPSVVPVEDPQMALPAPRGRSSTHSDVALDDPRPSDSDPEDAASQPASPSAGASPRPTHSAPASPACSPGAGLAAPPTPLQLTHTDTGLAPIAPENPPEALPGAVHQSSPAEARALTCWPPVAEEEVDEVADAVEECYLGSPAVCLMQTQPWAAWRQAQVLRVRASILEVTCVAQRARHAATLSALRTQTLVAPVVVRSGLIHTWKRRLAVLRDGCLRWYKADAETMSALEERSRLMRSLCELRQAMTQHCCPAKQALAVHAGTSPRCAASGCGACHAACCCYALPDDVVRGRGLTVVAHPHLIAATGAALPPHPCECLGNCYCGLGDAPLVMQLSNAQLPHLAAAVSRIAEASPLAESGAAAAPAANSSAPDVAQMGRKGAFSFLRNVGSAAAGGIKRLLGKQSAAAPRSRGSGLDVDDILRLFARDVGPEARPLYGRVPKTAFAVPHPCCAASYSMLVIAAEVARRVHLLSEQLDALLARSQALEGKLQLGAQSRVSIPNAGTHQLVDYSFASGLRALWEHSAKKLIGSGGFALPYVLRVEAGVREAGPMDGEADAEDGIWVQPRAGVTSAEEHAPATDAATRAAQEANVGLEQQQPVQSGRRRRVVDLCGVNTYAYRLLGDRPERDHFAEDQCHGKHCEDVAAHKQLCLLTGQDNMIDDLCDCPCCHSDPRQASCAEPCGVAHCRQCITGPPAPAPRILPNYDPLVRADTDILPQNTARFTVAAPQDDDGRVYLCFGGASLQQLWLVALKAHATLDEAPERPATEGTLDVSCVGGAYIGRILESTVTKTNALYPAARKPLAREAFRQVTDNHKSDTFECNHVGKDLYFKNTIYNPVKTATCPPQQAPPPGDLSVRVPAQNFRTSTTDRCEWINPHVAAQDADDGTDLHIELVSAGLLTTVGTGDVEAEIARIIQGSEVYFDHTSYCEE
jgi:hypothetical protein